ncbi:hypothetical protein [Caballeronia sp. GAWG1-1]|uniref:hypothetical protein n=1 Tax=Caballeronia sp. GAWG1-1 TaxID=2921742 RepID=UPI0020283E1C|nr:hypothetical protein [Caballeronia sp. GAWG1-1]
MQHQKAGRKPARKVEEAANKYQDTARRRSRDRHCAVIQEQIGRIRCAQRAFAATKDGTIFNGNDLPTRIYSMRVGHHHS